MGEKTGILGAKTVLWRIEGPSAMVIKEESWHFKLCKCIVYSPVLRLLEPSEKEYREYT